MSNVGDQACIGVWNRWSRKLQCELLQFKDVGDMFFKGGAQLATSSATKDHTINILDHCI